MKKSVFVFSLFLALIVISCGQKEKINQAEPYFVPVEETLLQDVTMTASDAEPGVANQWLAFRKDLRSVNPRRGEDEAHLHREVRDREPVVSQSCHIAERDHEMPVRGEAVRNRERTRRLAVKRRRVGTCPCVCACHVKVRHAGDREVRHVRVGLPGDLGWNL